MRCGVWGSPIAHSLSPVLHRAAYAELGLSDWTYDAREVDEAGFAAALAGLDAAWRGLSLTMPLKEVALRAAAEASATALETGAANTLVRKEGGWVGHNTDVHGVVAALREAGCVSPTRAMVIGSGATARSAVAALARLGVERVVLMVRGRPRPATVAQAQAAGLVVDVTPMGEWHEVDVLVSTVPPAAVTGLEQLPSAGSPHHPRTVLDVVYGQGRTALEAAAVAAGWRVQPGTAMLLHQATEQVRLMTGLAPPVAAMRTALGRALAVRTGQAPEQA